MKKWAPIIFAGLVVLLLRLPTYRMKKNVEEIFKDKTFQENVNKLRVRKGDYWAKKQLDINKKIEMPTFKELPKRVEIESPKTSLPLKLTDNTPNHSNISGSKNDIKTVKIQFSIDKNNVNINDTLSFSVIATDAESFPEINISPLQNDFEIVSGPVQQTNIAWVKGNMVTTKTLSWIILPRNVGDIIIPGLSGEVDGKSFRGKPIEISVEKRNSAIKNKFVDSESGFSIDFPPEWLIKESYISDVIIKAVKKTPDGKLAILSIKKVDIGIDDDMWTVTGPELFEDMKDESPKIDYELIDWGKSIIANNHCTWLTTQFQVGKFPTTMSTLYYFIHDKSLYRINFSVDKISGWYENIEEKARNSIASISFPNKPKQLKPNKYIDNQFGFSIVFPDNWNIRDAILHDEIAIKAVHKAENGDFATLIIYVWENDGIIDFSRFSGKDFFDYLNSEGGPELLDYGRKNINGKKSIWYKMKMDLMGTSSYSVTYVFSHNRYLYQLFGHTIFGDKHWYDKNEPKIISSIETFTLNN